tara:strand:+ start:128 stop:364 length:237 start_codon:yes stop_codon:yes gene_type:complete
MTTLIDSKKLLTSENLEDAGITESRIPALLLAASALHDAVCQIDRDRMPGLRTHFPEVITVAQMYGQADEILHGLENS